MELSVGLLLVTWIIGIIVCTPLVATNAVKNAMDWLTLQCMSLAIRFSKKKVRRLYKYSKYGIAKNPNIYDIGLFSTPPERSLEKRHNLQMETATDGIVFWGADWQQNEMFAKVIRRVNNVAEVCLLLRVNGTMYELPSDPDIRKAFVDPTNYRSFSAGGLKAQCLWPMRRWRISYNGLLKKITDSTDDDYVHCKFSFLWISVSNIHDSLHDFENSHLAVALENEKFHKFKETDMTRFYQINDKYEQWGMFCGTVNISKESDDQQIWMWGSRRRIMGCEDPSEERVRLDISMKNGFKIGIDAVNIPGYLKNYKNGRCHYQNYTEYLITRCQTDLLQMAKNKRFNSEFSFDFSSSRPKDGKHQMLMQPRGECIPFQGVSHHAFIFPFKVQYGKEIGLALLQYSINQNDIAAIENIQPLILLMDKESQEAPLSVTFDDVLCQSSSLVGGKGLSLGLLTTLSSKCLHRFSVPTGCVLTTAAYQRQVSLNKDVSEAVTRLEKALGPNERERVEEACNSIQGEFKKMQVDGTIKESLVKNLKKVFGDDFEQKSFAVRSSACGEDSEELSAAGQMSTILGVKGLPAICKAITECWASHFKYECVNYLRQNGQPIRLPMAVVVQEMVDAEAAGVLFTVHPVSNDPTFLCVTANYGLGESVVSASSEPDTFTLKRNKNNRSVELYRTEIGSKSSKIILKDDGVQELMVESTASSRTCLEQEMAVKLGELGLLVEECFCSARDIEWAIKDKRVYLLQARPITTMDVVTEFELIHDQDSASPTDSEYWSTANTGEILPQAMSPLTTSLLFQMFNGNCTVREKRYEAKGRSQALIYTNRVVMYSQNRAMINAMDTLYKMNSRTKTAVQKAFELGLFGRMIESNEMHEAGVARYGYVPSYELTIGITIFLVMFICGASRKMVKKIEKLVGEFSISTSHCQTSEEMYHIITEKLEGMREVDNCHGITTAASPILNMFLLMLLGGTDNEWTAETYDDLANLLSSCEQVESSDVPKAIRELSKYIKDDENCKEFISQSPLEATAWLRQHKGNVGKKFKEFLEKHGHRCVQELDFYVKPWRMEPENLVSALQASVRNMKEGTCREKEIHGVQEAISNLKTPLGYVSKFFMSLLIPYCRRAVGYREQSKAKYVKIIDIFRLAYHDLGEMMVREGRLPSKDLIFFLAHEEIGELIETRSPTLLNRAVKKQKLQNKLNENDFAEIMHGIPQPVIENKVANEIKGNVMIKGTPVSQGTVTARARVVVSLEKASEIQSGEILICRATDTGWSPYFPVLAGVVTELGGLISHGAVVAREYGIPCIVGVQRATNVFKTGDLLMMDATKGMLTRIEEQQ